MGPFQRADHSSRYASSDSSATRHAVISMDVSHFLGGAWSRERKVISGLGEFSGTSGNILDRTRLSSAVQVASRMTVRQSVCSYHVAIHRATGLQTRSVVVSHLSESTRLQPDTRQI